VYQLTATSAVAGSEVTTLQAQENLHSISLDDMQSACSNHMRSAPAAHDSNSILSSPGA
jgi:hypothetical protein